MRTAQDLAGLPHVALLEALADPGRRPAPPLGRTDLGEDLHLEAVGPTDLLQSGGVAGVATPEAHVVADDDRPGPEQPLQPGAHEVLGTLGGELKGVGDDQDGVKAEVLEGGQTVGQGGDEGQVRLRLVNAAGMRVEGDCHGQGAPVTVGKLTGELHHAAHDRLVTAVDAVEDAHGDHGAHSARRAQARWHLLGAVPDLHCRYPCSRLITGRAAPLPVSLSTHPRSADGSGEARRAGQPCHGGTAQRDLTAGDAPEGQRR